MFIKLLQLCPLSRIPCTGLPVGRREVGEGTLLRISSKLEPYIQENANFLPGFYTQVGCQLGGSGSSSSSWEGSLPRPFPTLWGLSSYPSGE